MKLTDTSTTRRWGRVVEESRGIWFDRRETRPFNDARRDRRTHDHTHDRPVRRLRPPPHPNRRPRPLGHPVPALAASTTDLVTDAACWHHARADAVLIPLHALAVAVLVALAPRLAAVARRQRNDRVEIVDELIGYLFEAAVTPHPRWPTRYSDQLVRAALRAHQARPVDRLTIVPMLADVARRSAPSACLALGAPCSDGRRVGDARRPDASRRWGAAPCRLMRQPRGVPSRGRARHRPWPLPRSPRQHPGASTTAAGQLSLIVRAATAADPGFEWVSALPCRRRPGRRACPGHVGLCRTDVPASIEWWCTSCDDAGLISSWERSPFDLRPQPEPTDRVLMTISADIAATLRSLRLLDSTSERIVFRARATERGIVLAADEDDLDELAGFIAAEANHEPDRRRQKRLDTAFAVVNNAITPLDDA